MVNIQNPDWLGKAMKEAGVQTGQLALRAGVSRSQIQRILNGMDPRLDTLRRLTGALESLKAEKPSQSAAA